MEDSKIKTSHDNEQTAESVSDGKINMLVQIKDLFGEEIASAFESKSCVLYIELLYFVGFLYIVP